jgi:hypothetical protein
MPVARFKAGQVSSALWENQIQVKGAGVTILKATVQRRYKDKSKNKKSTKELPIYPEQCNLNVVFLLKEGQVRSEKHR